MDNRLPDFLYKAISKGYTSIGENPAVPDIGDEGFIYRITKDRYSEVLESVENMGFDTSDIDGITTELSRLTAECMEHERPLRGRLEKVCENVIYEILAVPSDTVILKCKLTDSIRPDSTMRVMPEKEAYDFDDVEEMERLKSAVKRRRFTNAMVQGVSYYLSTCDKAMDIINGYLDTMDGDLVGFYEKIVALNDFLLFSRPDKIDEKNPMQDSYVEVKLGVRGKKTIIKSQGLTLPSLLRETFRGFFELFSSHALPEDDSEAMFILKRSDFIVAEPWDMRLGVPMWNKLLQNFPDDMGSEVVYVFTDIFSIDDDDEFNRVMKNMLLNTKSGKSFANDIYSSVEHDKEYQSFKDRIQKKNVDMTLISDGCFERDELANYTLNEKKWK